MRKPVRVHDGESSGQMERGRVRVGRAIRERRQKAGLTLSHLAEAIGVALSTMSKIENGKISTSFERFNAIADVLQIDLVQIIGPQSGGEAPPSPSKYGTRRTVTRLLEYDPVDAGNYVEWYHATEMLHKNFQPMVAELSSATLAQYGEFTRHKGEEWNYVLEGELEFHTEVYAPVRLAAGDSIYFDAEMKHAHIRLGDAPCRMIAVISARVTAREGGFDRLPSLRIVRGAVSTPTDERDAGEHENVR